jgi:tetratricopeptide (TPR) repeat protein
VYTALQLIDSNNHVTGEMHSEDYPQADFLALMLFRNLIPTVSTLMGKSSCFKRFPFDGTFKHAEDYELSLRLARHFHFKYLDLPLTQYRRHESNLSNNLQAHRQAEMKIVGNYSKKEIEDIVDRTTFSSEGKLLLKGRILFNQERFEEALHFFEQVQTGLALFYKGNCFFRLLRPDAAHGVYQQALALDPLNAACWNNLGVTYAMEKHFDRARECFQRALECKAGYRDAAFNLDHAREGELRMTWRELRKNLLPYS